MKDPYVIIHPVRVSISAWQNPRQPSDACGANEAGFAAVTSLPTCRRQEPGASKGTVNFFRVFERRCCVKEIYKKDSNIALINVFTVEPANHQRLIDPLARATDGVVDRTRFRFLDAPSEHRRNKSDHVRPVAQRGGLSRHAAGSRPFAVPGRGAHDRQVRTGHIRDRANFLACRRTSPCGRRSWT
jgi:hypothetical protein